MSTKQEVNSLLDKLFRRQNQQNSTSNNTLPYFLDISDNDLVQTYAKIESTAYKEGDNSDYEPKYEDISDVEDLM